MDGFFLIIQLFFSLIASVLQHRIVERIDMNWKGYGRKRSAYFMVVYQHLSGEV